MQILLVDDHEMVRLGLKSYLDVQNDVDMVVEASSGCGKGSVITTRCDNDGYCHA